MYFLTDLIPTSHKQLTKASNGLIDIKKSLKIPNRRRIDNTMSTLKSTKGQTTIYKTYTCN